MTNTGFLRHRKYTYYEMVNFAKFYTDNHLANTFANETNVDVPFELLRLFLNLRKTTADVDYAMQIVTTIESIVATYYNLPLDAIRGKRRFGELVRARQVIAYWSVKYAPQTVVADALSGNNRNNVQYGKTKCADLMETEPTLAKEVAEIGETIRMRMEYFALKNGKSTNNPETKPENKLELVEQQTNTNENGNTTIE